MDGVIDMINQVLGKGLGKSVAYVDVGYVFCEAMHTWLEQLVQEGVTTKMIEDLNTELEGIRFQHVLKKDDSGEPTWLYIADYGFGQDADSRAAYAFSQLLTCGALEGLKKCQMSDCDNFFLGRPNAKWCSKKCGARHRVRSKRKRDR